LVKPMTFLYEQHIKKEAFLGFFFQNNFFINQRREK